MPNNSVPVAAFPSTRLDSIRRCSQHLRSWLAVTGLAYDCAAREGFVRAHPALFGRAFEVTLRGYEQWRTRHRRTDTAESFARYIARRHQRWLGANPGSPALAPCLLGIGNTQPCWVIPDGGSIIRVDFGVAA
jgi:hypothetical protein